MPALDVVGEDLERGRGIDERLAGEEEILVGLHGVGLLRVRANDDLSVKDAARLAVQDPLIELAAGAVRHGVVDQGVVVHVLGAGAEKEPVQRALAPLALEDHVPIGPRERRSQAEVVRHVVARPPLGDLDRLDVEGGEILALQLVVLEHGALAQDDFGHRVGEVRAPSRSLIRLDHDRLASRLRHDQVSQMGHGRLPLALGKEVEQDRLRDGRAALHVDERPVGEKGGVQRRERALLEIGVTGEVGLGEARLGGQHVFQPRDVGSLAGWRQLESEILPLSERDPRDPGHARVLPCLVARPRQAERAEAIHPLPPQAREPVGLTRGSLLAEILEARPIEVVLFGDGFHG